ncbi:MAG: DNA methyltransferase, partial [Pseudomonadota bacterium]
MIIKGHALEVLKSLPAATVQCCVTSPPYWSLRRYPIEDQEWPEFEGLAAGWITLPRCNRWKGQLGLEPTPELYVAHLTQVFREVRRVLRDDGTLWLNLGDSFCGGG